MIDKIELQKAIGNKIIKNQSEKEIYKTTTRV